MRCLSFLLHAILVFLGSLVAHPLIAQSSLQHEAQAADTVWLDLPLHDGDVLVHEERMGIESFSAIATLGRVLTG